MVEVYRDSGRKNEGQRANSGLHISSLESEIARNFRNPPIFFI